MRFRGARSRFEFDGCLTSGCAGRPLAREFGAVLGRTGWDLGSGDAPPYASIMSDPDKAGERGLR